MGDTILESAWSQDFQIGDRVTLHSIPQGSGCHWASEARVTPPLVAILLVLSVLFINIARAVPDQVAIPNSGFEGKIGRHRVPEGWQTWVREGHGEQVTFSMDSQVVQGGKRSVKIVNRGYGDCSYYLKGNIPVSWSTSHLCRSSAFVKCEEVEGVAVLQIFSVDAQGHKDWQLASAQSAGTHDWRPIATEFALLPDVEEIGIQLKLIGPGTVWFDSIHLDVSDRELTEVLLRGEKQFVEIPRARTAGLPKLTGEQRQRGYVVFVREEPDDVFPSSVPQKDELTTTMEIYAAQDEYEPTPFSVHALRDLENVRVSVTDLAHSDGETIARDAIDMRVVGYWPQRISWNSTNYRVIPELLEHRETVDIARNTSQQFWPIIKIPPEAAPGEYRSKVSIVPENADSMHITLKVKVWPFTLKTPPDRIWGMYSDNRRWKRYTLAQIEAELRDMKEHGMSTILLYPIAPERCFLEDGHIAVDLAQTSAHLEIFKKVGLQGPIVLDLQDLETILSQLLSSKGFVCEKKHDQAFTEVVGKLAGVADRHGWPEVLFHLVDEPGNNPEKREKALKLYKLVKEAGFRTFTTADVVFCNEALDPWLDVRCYHLAYVSKTAKQCHQRRKEAQTSGDAFWWYGSGCYPGQEGNMAANRYLVGILFWKTKASGQWSWTFQRPRGDPYDDFDNLEKDACITYPTIDGKGLITTLQWEGIREGVDDLRYIYTLEALIEEGSRSFDEIVRAKAQAAKEELDRMLNDAPWLYDSEARNGPANRMRRRLAQRIVELSNSLDPMDMKRDQRDAHFN
jgi:hypothetical protein